MKKFLIISICLILTLASLNLFNAKNQKASASEDYENYLISPTSISATENKLFVYDAWENEIISYNLSSKERTASVSLSGVSKLKIKEDKLYVLTEVNASQMEIGIYNLSLQQLGSLSLRNGHSYIDFVISDSDVKALKADGNIDIFSLTESTLTYQFTRDSSAWAFNGLISRNIVGMNSEGENITLIFTSGIYTHNTQTNTDDNIYTAPTGVVITHSSDNHVRLSNKDVVKVSTGTVVATTSTDCSGLASAGDKVYLSNENSHQVFIVEDGNIADIKLNPDIEPTMFKSNNFIHIKLNADANLKLKPYSVKESRTLQAGCNLTVIGEIENHYYCLYVGERNEFLYLDKTTSNFEVINIGSTSTIYVVTIPTQIRSLPSSILDSNTIISDIQAGEMIVVKNSTIIKNSDGELFYLVEIGEEYGFIKYSAVQSTRGNYELTTPCNAKTKRATTLFEKADGSVEIITLEKGTRIAMQEETGPTKEYVRIEYQDTNGIIYSGYVLADDIDPDGLSTLQILGLVLVGTNLTLLITIVLIKRRSKKWKV